MGAGPPVRPLTPSDAGSKGARDTARCCIAGCGPAGAVLGFLLARAGVDVLVLEKHGDFLRDFRGDTIHPSTLEILDEVGLAGRFLELPHSRVAEITLRTTAGEAARIDFRGIRTRYPYIAFVPQWDFLNFLTGEAKRYPGFRLLMNAEVTGVLREDGAVQGIRYRTADGEHDARVPLVVGADGRDSRTRAAVGLPQTAASPPIDVFWFRLDRRPSDRGPVGAVIGPGHFIALFERGDFWQVAYVIGKGRAGEIRAAGLEAFRRSVVSLLPEFEDRVGALRDWEQIKLLTVRADRLTRWYAPGYLAIGDAAHAMSPVGGVGINVAIQDAVAAANILWAPLRRGRVPVRDLAAVQRRREFSVRVIQWLQAAMQRQLLVPVLSGSQGRAGLPTAMRIMMRVPGLRQIPPRLIALGVQRPHVESPALAEGAGRPAG